MNIKIIPIDIEHLDEIYQIEKESFLTPWSKENILREIQNKDLSIYCVAINELNEVCGYAGMWHVINEGHITNIAIKNKYQNKKIGQKLINNLIEIASNKNMTGITLEVNVNNKIAQHIYKKLGFKIYGLRKNYYHDTKDDALIMWKYFR